MSGRMKRFSVVLVDFDGVPRRVYTGYGPGWSGMQRETDIGGVVELRQWDRKTTLPDGTVIAFECQPQERR